MDRRNVQTEKYILKAARDDYKYSLMLMNPDTKTKHIDNE